MEHYAICVKFIILLKNFNFKAPEVILNKNYKYTADYFALGVLTYELMTGHVLNIYRDHLKEKIKKKLKNQCLMISLL